MRHQRHISTEQENATFSLVFFSRFSNTCVNKLIITMKILKDAAFILAEETPEQSFYQSQPKSQTDFTLSLIITKRQKCDFSSSASSFFPKSKTPTQTRVRSETEAMKTTPKNICFPTNLIKTMRTKSCTKLGLSTTDWNN